MGLQSSFTRLFPVDRKNHSISCYSLYLLGPDVLQASNSAHILPELFEIAFIIITAIIISEKRSKRTPEIKQGVR